MQTSEQINEIAAALAKAQGAYESATKDSLNPHFGRKYADLASGINACRKALSDNGISVVQDPSSPESGVIVVETRLMHSSGQWISGTLTMPAREDAQGYGSGITYARRYALFAMVGIAPEDDDGNAAQPSRPAEPEQGDRRPRPASLPKAKPRTPEQRETMNRLSKELGLTAPAAEALCREVTGGGPGELTEDTARKLIEAMQERVLERAKTQTTPPSDSQTGGV